MKVLRTPDERFENLPGYAFTPNYLTIDDTDGGELRVHYLDEGNADANPVLLMHGEPSWSYVYRKMIPGLVAAGHRAIAPDLIGFGRSDKPTQRADYTYLRHIQWMQQLLDQLDLKNITLFCQDWGGLIGLRLVVENPDRFDRVVVANTFLPTGGYQGPGKAFLEWQAFSQSVPEFPTGEIVQGATASDLSAEVVAAYDAPYPNESYKEGARQFPLLVPISPDDPEHDASLAAWKVLGNWTKPFLTSFSDKNSISAGGDKLFQERIPGTKGQAHVLIKDGGYFLQEDQGEELAKVVNGFIAANPVKG